MTSVLILPSYYPSKTEPTAGIYVKFHAEAMVRQGLSVAVACIAYSQTDEPLEQSVEGGVTVIRGGFADRLWNNLSTRSIRYAIGLPHKIINQYEKAYLLLVDQGFKPDIIHVHVLWPAGIAAVYLSKKYGIPIVVTEHSTEYSADSHRKLVRMPGMLAFKLRPLAKRASAYIAVSELFAKRLQELDIYSNIEVVPNLMSKYMEWTPFPTDGPLKTVHISQLGPEKNIKMLIDAVRLAENYSPGFLLEIVGDSVYRDELELYAKDAGVLNRIVYFRGRKTPEDVNKILSTSIFSIVSALHETFSVAAAESLLCGRPVITTRCGGPESFVNADVGMVVENDNALAMAEGIQWMLAHYVDFEPVRVSEYARALFSEEAIVNKLESIYQRVLDVK